MRTGDGRATGICALIKLAVNEPSGMWRLAWALVALLAGGCHGELHELTVETLDAYRRDFKAPTAARGVGVRRLLFEYGKVNTQAIRCAYEKAGYTTAFRREVSNLEPCDELPFLVATHDEHVARRVLACSRDVVVWSIARDFATRTPSAFWENTRFYARGCDRADAAAMQGAYERTLRWSVLDGRRHAPGRGPCTFFSRLAETLNATLTPFDGRRSVARGGTHAALVTRVEDTAEWEGIVADFLPEFSFDATCRGKHVRRGSDRNYDAFLERVTPPTAAQAALYATCDTAAFYDATWNRVVNRATGVPHDTRGCLSA